MGACVIEEVPLFQTEPIIWLQGFASPALTWLMTTVTLLGYTPVYAALILVLAFGIRLRPSLGVLVALLLTGILTEGLKNGLALPRPGDIDAQVEALGDQGGGYGFPSGHVSTATAFLVGVALFFRSRQVLAFAALWIPMMAVSRMYLGRHFLADVLGGFAVGLLAILAAALLLRPLERRQPSQPLAPALAPLGLVSLILVALTPFVAFLSAQYVGRLAGVVVAYGVLLMMGFPPDHGSMWRRGARVCTAAALYLATSQLLDALFEVMGWMHTRPGTMTAAALATAVALAGTVAVSRRARLYLVA